MSDSPQQPAQPNYGQIAQQQGAANIDTARVQGKISNPNVNTPYGTQTVTWDGNTDQPTVSQSLAPAQQGILDSQNKISQGLLNTGQTALGQAQDSLSKPMDQQGVQDIYDTAYKTQTDRLDPQWAQADAMQKTQLANQGLTPGGEAYDNAMRTFSQGKNDAYSQARQSAIATMPQTFQLAQSARELPLNEVNALRTGNQVQNPQFQQFQGSQVGQTPLMQAAQAQQQANQGLYSLQTAQNNNNMSGLYSLGAAGLGAYGSLAAAGMAF